MFLGVSRKRGREEVCVLVDAGMPGSQLKLSLTSSNPLNEKTYSVHCLLQAAPRYGSSLTHSS